MNRSSPDVAGEIYIGTVMFERNRRKLLSPSFKVSEWIERFRLDGFDGMELWENHALLFGPEEVNAIEQSGFPVAVYNSYTSFDDEGKSMRERAATAAVQLRAGGVKFNLGGDPAIAETYLRNLLHWSDRLPEDCRLLCECHGGTIMKNLETATEIYERLDTGNFQIIIHPLSDPFTIRKWFDSFGGIITHAHIQSRNQEGKLVKLKNNRAKVEESLAILKNAGFKGSYTLEFTEGSDRPDVSAEELYRHALDDLEFLKENLTW
jgi:hypothetical protein